MTLYDIRQEIMSCLDLETGEIIDEAKLEALQLQEEEKIENVGLWIKNLNAEISVLKAERDSFNQRIKVAENKAESLKKYLTEALNGNIFKTSKIVMSYRKSEKVVIAEDAKIPDEYLTFKAPEPKKAELKKALKAGESFQGVELVTSQNLQIK